MSDPISLKEFLESRISDLEKRFDQRFSDLERRNDQRFTALDDATKIALVTTKEALTIAVSGVERSSAATVEANRVLALKAEEAADQKLEAHNNIRPWVQSLYDTLCAKISAVDNNLSEKIAINERRISRFENREEGMTMTTKVIVGAAGLLATLVGLYFALGL